MLSIAIGGMVRLLTVVTLLVVAATTVAAEPRVTDVRLGAHPDKTRFVMEISEAPPYRVFTLPDPYRVVIDLPEISWDIPDETAGETETGLIEALRFGLFAPGTSRVVLDMRAPIEVTDVFVLPAADGKPHRLVLDIKEIAASAFLSDEKRRAITSEEPLPSTERRVGESAPAGDQRKTVVIDAGHGGVDPGAIGVSGTYEKDIALTYATHLRDLLEESGRYRVVMTRDEDIFLRLRDRVAIAQEADGDIFISLHANTHPSENIRGASVFTLSETASDSEAAALAAKENKADIIAGVDLRGQTDTVSQILIDLAQRETMNASKHFANLLVNELDGRVKLLNNTHRFAGFAVLKSPNVPSVLFEVGYMSNPEEERRLRSTDHRENVNRSVARAIDRYFEWQEARN